MMINHEVYCSTILRSNSGTAYIYELNLTLDKNGRVLQVTEKAEGMIMPRPYQLLNLMKEVYDKLGIERTNVAPAKFIKNPVSQPGAGYHPAFDVGGKRYRLDQCVTPDWLMHVPVRAIKVMLRGAEEHCGDYDANRCVAEIAGEPLWRVEI